ncbi:MAG: response regulator [Candidatus Sericytochromatia bacterium]
MYLKKNFIFLLFLSLFLISCKSEKKQPEINNGVIDLRNWDFKANGPINLKGSWEFYWNELVTPSNLLLRTKAPDYIDAPSPWNYYEKGQKYSGSGFATYHIKVLLDDRPEQLGLYLPDQESAYNMYIQNVLVQSNGHVSQSPNSFVPQYLPSVTFFENSSKEISLTLQMSSFKHKNGGMINSIWLGNYSQIQRKRENNLLFELFLIGSILVISFYHMSMYLLRKKDKPQLFFGVFCLLITLRILTTGERVMAQYFPNLPWDIYIRLEYLSFYLSIPFWILFISSIFKKSFPKNISNILVITGLLFSATTFLPSKIFTGYLTYYQIYTFISGVICILLMAKGFYQKEKGSILFLIGWGILFISVINDILNLNYIINTPQLFPIGLFLFINFQAIVLSRNIIITFNKSEKLSLELKEKNEALKKLDVMKDEFLANTSHELRTPLNGIIGIAESMVDGATGELTYTQTENLKMIIGSGKRLSNLVMAILDFSKLKNQKIVINQKAVDLHQSSNLTLNFYRTLIKDKNLVLVNNVDKNFPEVYADEDKLQQILQNLIDNAIKFTESGRISVSAEIVGEKGSRIAQVTVSDTGIGIAQEKFALIFESFVQGDASIEREYGGTGLGLSITKHLVELHKGNIKVESELGTGSKFIFTLPLSNEIVNNSELEENNYLEEKIDKFEQRKNEEKEVYNGPERRKSRHEKIMVKKGDGGKILIVDDEPVNLQVLKNILGLHDYEIIQAQNGIETLKLIDNGLIPDLIVLDVMMPKMSGFEVCRKIREKWNASQLPVILLTAKDQTYDLIEGLESGANDYIPKPFSKNELLARIKTHLHLSKITEAYGRFVPGEFLKFLQKESIIDVKLGDQIQKEMTILFTDIRSFTKISESMTPKENFDFINTLLERIGPIIRERNGFIDKYIGDAIMALFPLKPQDALEASIKMRKELVEYNKERVANGLIPINTGTGIHFGNLMLGTIGEKKRMDGTVISDAVNLASRLEGLTSRYGSSIIISENVLKLIDNPENYHFRFLEKTTVKGKNVPVSVYEVFDCDDEDIINLKNLLKNDFEKGVKYFSEENYEEAKIIFSDILAKNPKDKAAEYFYSQIINKLRS